MTPTVNYFELARTVPMPELVAKYTGSPLIRKGSRYFILCPFHAEKTASCSLNQRYFKCFGCGESGDGITFVGKLFNVTPLEAAKTICRDFNLAVTTDPGPGTRGQPDPALKRERSLRAAFDATVEVVCARLTLLHRCAERTGLVERDIWWRKAVGEIARILDHISSRDVTVQVAAWRESKKWV